MIFIEYANKQKSLFSLDDLPPITCTENWLIIIATLYLLHIPLEQKLFSSLHVPEHRLEKVTTLNNIEFYNDSKSTIPEATLSAVEKLQHKPIILLLGGLSKGVDRAPLIKNLHHKVKALVCFGKEAQMLHQNALEQNIFSHATHSLDEAIKKAYNLAQLNDIILLSPAGSSFDLFKNYEERGKYFKKLIAELKNSPSSRQ